MQANELNAREQQVLEAVIHSYVETAEPAGSRTIAKKYRLGVSAATVRNTMSDLEDRGFLYHPHTSAGRIPTDLAYRVYVDNIIDGIIPAPTEHAAVALELGSENSAIEGLLGKAAQVLGVVTKELGVAVAPSFDEAVLEKLQLLPVSSDRLLMILVLRRGAARTIFVEVPSHLPGDAVEKVALVLNERLSGLPLREIRETLKERLRDSLPRGGEKDLINIFVEEADHIFSSPPDEAVVLGSAQMLVSQPEFNSNERMRDLLELTERKDLLKDALLARPASGMTITIGGENDDPKLSSFTLVTSTYRVDGLSGVIGVMGPTRMPYKKVIALVEHTSRLVGELL